MRPRSCALANGGRATLTNAISLVEDSTLSGVGRPGASLSGTSTQHRGVYIYNLRRDKAAQQAKWWELLMQGIKVK